jgi:hypothetical protein
MLPPLPKGFLDVRGAAVKSHPFALAVALLLGAGSLGSDERARKPPKEPHEPLAVYVYSEGPETLQHPDRQTQWSVVESVEEQVEREKDWFKLVTDPSDAEIKVQITRQWFRKGGIVADPGRWDPLFPGGPPPRSKTTSRKDKYFVDADFITLGQTAKSVRASREGPEPSVVALDLVRRLKDFCKDNYWTLRDLQLILAAWQGDTAKVKILLDAGADVNAKDDDGVTVLMWAVLSSSVEAVRILLEAGADVTAKANDGSTARMLAPDNSEIAQLLSSARF